MIARVIPKNNRNNQYYHKGIQFPELIQYYNKKNTTFNFIKPLINVPLKINNTNVSCL